VAGQVTGKGKSRVMPRPRLKATGLHAAHSLAQQFVGPRARLAGRLVRAVKVDQDLIPGGFLEQGRIEIDDLLVFVIEKINLGPDDAEVVQFLEKILTCFRGAKLLGMSPE